MWKKAFRILGVIERVITSPVYLIFNDNRRRWYHFLVGFEVEVHFQHCWFDGRCECAIICTACSEHLVTM